MTCHPILWIRWFALLFLLISCTGNSGSNSNDSDGPSIDPAVSELLSEIASGMVGLPGGTFRMGDIQGYSLLSDVVLSERPIHLVTLDSFYISDHEVTYGEFRQLKPDHENLICLENDCPVNNVTWDDANEFAAYLSQHEAVPEATSYRLCTEAEWEYATRAGTETRFFCGNEEECLDEVAWYSENSNESPHPVKSKLPNPWGLYNMLGNVSEWVQDWFGDYSESPSTNPQGPSSGRYRVIRGGNFLSSDFSLRSSNRSRQHSDGSSQLRGFRLCRSKGSETSVSLGSIITTTTSTTTVTTLPPVSILSPADANGMVHLSAGTFRMGAIQGEFANGGLPVHIVTLDSFYISDHEVTYGEYKQYVLDHENLGCSKDDCPVNNVSWGQADDYTEFLNQNGGGPNGTSYRLCTEAEWEYAARGGTEAIYSCGNEEACLDKVAWYSENSDGTAHTVKGKQANTLGLYDMHGNVMEFVNDWYDDSYYSVSPSLNPQGSLGFRGSCPTPLALPCKVMRGGSFVEGANLLGISYRHRNLVIGGGETVGFRVCSS